MHVAFEILNVHQAISISWTKASGHIIFDAKMDLLKKQDGLRTDIGCLNQ